MSANTSNCVALGHLTSPHRALCVSCGTTLSVTLSVLRQALCSSTKYADDWEAATMLQVGAVEAVVVRLVDEAAHPDVLAIALVAATNMSESACPIPLAVPTA